MPKLPTLARVRRPFPAIVLLLLIGILLTRIPSLMHEINLHPDEDVFADAAASVVTGDYQFSPGKNYPNGAFVFYMPFQFVGEVLRQKFGYMQNDPELHVLVWNRIGALCYFSLGSLVALFFLRRKTGSMRICFYFACLMVFSLFHIEQSRYGTCEPITLLLTFSIFLLLDRFLTDDDDFAFYFASFLTGVITAVKFPLMAYLAFPLCAAALKPRQGNKRLMRVSLLFPLFLAGLLIFSPSCYTDPAHFMKAFFTEYKAYVVLYNAHGIGSPPNHLGGILLYAFLYADFPLAPLFAVFALWKKNRKSAVKDLFFHRVIPLFTLAFLLFNLFAATLFMRTLYPFFFIMNLYVAIGLDDVTRLLSEKKRAVFSWIFASLALFFVVRGILFTVSLAGVSPRLQAQEALSRHPQWEERDKTVLMGTFFFPAVPEKYYWASTGVLANMNPEVIREGEFWVTCAIENVELRPRPFGALGLSADSRTAEVLARQDLVAENWRRFQADNQAYHFASVEFPFEHALYGAWVHGSTLAAYEFPYFHLYYRPQSAGFDAELQRRYHALYEVTDPVQYFEALGEIDSAVVLLSNRGKCSPYVDQCAEKIELLALLNLYGQENYAGVFDAEGNVLFESVDMDTLTVDLQEEIDLPLSITSGKVKSLILFEGRDYSRNVGGLNVAIYDPILNTCVDWFAFNIVNERLVMARGFAGL